MALVLGMEKRRHSEQYIGWMWASVILPLALPFLWACFIFIIGAGFGVMGDKSDTFPQKIGYVLYTVIANGTFVFFGTDLLMNMQDSLIAGWIRSWRKKQQVLPPLDGEHKSVVNAMLRIMEQQQGARDKAQILPEYPVWREKIRRLVFYLSASLVYLFAVTLFAITLYASSRDLRMMFPAPTLEESIDVFFETPLYLVLSHSIVTAAAVSLALHLAKLKEIRQMYTC